MKTFYIRPVTRTRELALETGLLNASTDTIPIVPVDPGFSDSQPSPSWGDLNGE